MKNVLLPLLAAALVPAGPLFAALTIDDAEIVSSFGISKIYKPDGSTGNFNGETHSDDGFRKVFNGNYNDNIYMNTAKSYIVVDLDKALAGGYFVTQIKIAHKGNAQYSLYAIGEDGSTQTTLASQVTTSGITSYSLNAIATKIKYVFETVVSWQPSLCEIEVWGVDPSQMECLHKDEWLSAWVEIPGSSTCTENGHEAATCSNCGTVLTRQTDEIPMLGHDYVSTLDRPGSGLQFGSGTIACRRHDLEIVCTNGPVDLVLYGGLSKPGIVQFTDASVSSTGNEDWGVRPELIIDNAWGHTWPYWYANSKAVSEFVQFDFGVPVDLTSVDVSLPNRTQTLQFYSVVDGVEILVGEYAEEKDENASVDAGQRFEVEFRGVTLQTLRIKSADSNNAFGIYELHPYGTVAGAGKTAAVRTRIIID